MERLHDVNNFPFSSHTRAHILFSNLQVADWSYFVDQVDVFSFGIVLWEILTGEEPYANMHYGAIIGTDAMLTFLVSFLHQQMRSLPMLLPGLICV